MSFLTIIRTSAFAVGALLVTLPVAVRAQVRPDSTARDSSRARAAGAADSAQTEPDSVMRARILARSDSARRVYLADTLKTPVARFEMPDSQLELSTRLRFDREQILSSSAVNLADLLDRVPGVATFRSSWIAGIHTASYLGDGRRIRYFLDGIELGSTDPRDRGSVDLTSIPLWTLDELVVERDAGEIRIWMRTLSAVNVTPFSRVDIFTGDLNTNAFRGFIARRWRNGVMFQAGGQQVATQSGRVSAFATGSTQGEKSAGSVQLFMTRLGWARGKWSVDVYGQGGARDRDQHRARDSVGLTDLPSYKGAAREGYFRVGYGDTLGGLWAQAIAHTSKTRIEPDSASSRDTVFGGENTAQSLQRVRPDTTWSRTQQVLAIGYRHHDWAVSLTDRIRPLGGQSAHSPALRASLKWRGLALGGWIERSGPDSINRTSINAVYRPTSWLAFNVGRTSRSPVDSGGQMATSTLRSEAAVRYRDLWFSAGILRDDAVEYANIELIGLPGIRIFAPAAQGLSFGVHGRLYKDLGFDMQALKWNTSQFSRPPMQIRAEVNLISDWLSRFPSGEFGISARLSYEFRDRTPFFYGADAAGEHLDIRITETAQVATAHLEIRIQRGTLFYQFRNLSGGQYEQIRGITMPPAVQMYGMRWEFWN